MTEKLNDNKKLIYIVLSVFIVIFGIIFIRNTFFPPTISLQSDIKDSKQRVWYLGDLDYPEEKIDSNTEVKNIVYVHDKKLTFKPTNNVSSLQDCTPKTDKEVMNKKSAEDIDFSKDDLNMDKSSTTIIKPFKINNRYYAGYKSDDSFWLTPVANKRQQVVFSDK